MSIKSLQVVGDSARDYCDGMELDWAYQSIEGFKSQAYRVEVKDITTE
ncbi:MAG: hypothetical protein ACK5WZ_14065 [Pseudobdellovibrionaceae bacterium]